MKIFRKVKVFGCIVHNSTTFESVHEQKFKPNLFEALSRFYFWRSVQDAVENMMGNYYIYILLSFFFVICSDLFDSPQPRVGIRDLRVPWENSHRKEHYHVNPTLIKWLLFHLFIYIALLV
jgi:hypothetical protein